MAVTREQFESGMTYDAYKAQMTRNQEQVEQNEKDLQLKPEDVKAFTGLAEDGQRHGPGRGLVRRRRRQPADPGQARRRSQAAS